MVEHGVHRMKQLDGDHDQRLLGRFALPLGTEGQQAGKAYRIG
jgi:hypothetical protein